MTLAEFDARSLLNLFPFSGSRADVDSGAIFGPRDTGGAYQLVVQFYRLAPGTRSAVDCDCRRSANPASQGSVGRVECHGARPLDTATNWTTAPEERRGHETPLSRAQTHRKSREHSTETRIVFGFIGLNSTEKTCPPVGVSLAIRAYFSRRFAREQVHRPGQLVNHVTRSGRRQPRAGARAGRRPAPRVPTRD